jgi:hypothetical protein
MFRDIVAFFQAAGASRGREQWRVKLDDAHLDLKDFQSFLASWSKVEAELDIPAIDWRRAEALREAAQIVPGLTQSLSTFLHDDKFAPSSGDAAVDAWLLAYKRGEYRPIPSVLLPHHFGPGLADAAAITWAGIERVRTIWGDRETMMADRHALTSDMADGLAPGSVAQHETDYWLCTSVHLLGRILRLPAEDQAALGAKLEARYRDLARRKLSFKADVQALERILSLPVWRRRHELYAVWIATEMVRALDGHDVELHHEDGSIVFAFKDTVVATVRSAAPERTLVAERRTPLADPVGKGRTGAVQPDYGVWSEGRGGQRCDLIVEVKHYKREAKGPFRDVLIDYTRAHPGAQVVLVNHGPASAQDEGLDRDAARRSEVLGDLTPTNRSQRDALAALVREAVGEPALRAFAGGFRPNSVLAVDVSGSMVDWLASDDFERLLTRFAAAGGGEVALVDSRIRDRLAPAKALAAIRTIDDLAGTALADPIRALLAEHGVVYVVTDQEGARDLEDLAPRVLAGDEVRLLAIARPR